MPMLASNYMHTRYESLSSKWEWSTRIGKKFNINIISLYIEDILINALFYGAEYRVMVR